MSALDRTRPQKSAGLPLSVGTASLPLRLFIAATFGVIGGLCISGGTVLSATGPAAGTVVATALIVPLGEIALLAAAYVVAPLSRFGTGLDRFLGAMNARRAVAVVAALWGVAAFALAVASRLL